MARRTLSLSYKAAWQLLTSPEGTAVWLGNIGTELAKGAVYTLSDGTHGEVTVFSPNSHLRLTRHVLGWSRPSTVQVRVIATGSYTTTAFHEEHMPGPSERAARRTHYHAALTTLEAIIAQR